MKRIRFDGGYVRPGRATFAEAEWMFGVLADWPAGGWSLQRCLAQLSKSAQQPDFGQFVGLILVYCLPDDTPVGVARCSFHVGGTTGFQVDFAAVHPDHRGAGHFTRFSDAIAYWANQVLEADEGSYEVIESAPQVLHRSRALNAEERGQSRSVAGRSTEIRLGKAATAESVKAKSIEVE